MDKKVNKIAYEKTHKGSTIHRHTYVVPSIDTQRQYYLQTHVGSAIHRHTNELLLSSVQQCHSLFKKHSGTSPGRFVVTLNRVSFQQKHSQ